MKKKENIALDIHFQENFNREVCIRVLLELLKNLLLQVHLINYIFGAGTVVKSTELTNTHEKECAMDTSF